MPFCTPRTCFSACRGGKGCTPRRRISACREGRGCTAAQLSFSFPWGQGLHAAQLCFSLPCGQGCSPRSVFPLAVRAGVAVRAVVFHLPVRAGVAVRAAGFHLPVRAGVHAAHWLSACREGTGCSPRSCLSLAVRAGVARRAPVFQLAVRAGGARRALVFQVAKRTRATRLAPIFPPSVMASLRSHFRAPRHPAHTLLRADVTSRRCLVTFSLMFRIERGNIQVIISFHCGQSDISASSCFRD